MGIYEERRTALVAGDDRQFSATMKVAAEGGPSVATPACSEEDLQRAEAVLYELALVLRRVPVGERTRELHLRALHLKRDVARWHSHMADDATRRAVLDELGRLQSEAAIWDRGSSRGPRGRRSAPARPSRQGGSQDDGTT
jgi:hypothetical protein